MAFKFPFTNYHELNLTWVLDQLKALFEKSEENVTTIETYNDRLTAVETELPVISETASEASRAAAAAGTLAQTAKATADTAQENAIQAQTLAGAARQEAQAAQTAANEAAQAAQQAQATAQNFDGRITQAENDSSQALEASRSFENRVQAAITTANNANQTATNAQGIAMRADQNAGAALDRIGDLSQLETEAKQNLVAAINEALENGGKVDSVNGKKGVVVLDAGDIGYNGSTVEGALNGKQNAPTAAGTAGQVLGLNNNLQPVWVDQTGGSSGNIINTVSGYKINIKDGATNGNILNLSGNLVAELGIASIVKFLDSGNLINFSEVQERYQLNRDTGETVYSAGYCTTGYIEITNIDLCACSINRYTSGHVPVICFYSSDKSFISGYTYSTVQFSKIGFTIPEGAVFVRLSAIFGTLRNTKELNRLYIGDSSNLFIEPVDFGLIAPTNSFYDLAQGYIMVNDERHNFTPISIKTSYGEQTFAVNCALPSVGNTLKYEADLKLYIDNKIAELQALILEQ